MGFELQERRHGLRSGKGNPAMEHMAWSHSEIQRTSSPEDRAWHEELRKDLETG